MLDLIALYLENLQMLNERIQVQPDKMILPPCPLPRPGETVTWFETARRETGQLTGHTGGATPIVLGKFNREHRPSSYHAIRVTNPFKRRGPVWEHLPNTALLSAHDSEKERFRYALGKVIPPGPTYMELIDEIWSRGFEVFLVGGTVRDVVNGEDANDIDLVTTMPLALGLEVLGPMFNDRKLKVVVQTGYCRLGGCGRESDPFIDLKMVCLDNLGTPNARFGTDLSVDVAHRDFACNSLYYDPKSEVIIDPVGCGLADAEQKVLTIVADKAQKSSIELAKIAIRYFKFAAKGYTPCPEAVDQLALDFVPELAAMPQSQRISYTRTQILSKYPRRDWNEKLRAFRDAMFKYNHEEPWTKLFGPIEQDILGVER